MAITSSRVCWSGMALFAEDSDAQNRNNDMRNARGTRGNALKTPWSVRRPGGFFLVWVKISWRCLGMAQTKSLAQMRTALTRAHSTISNLKEDTREATRRVVISTMTVAGGGVAGFMEAKYTAPVPGTSLQYAEVLAGGLLTLGVMEAAGDYSDELGALGAGMAAALLSRRVRDATLIMEAKV